jgi:hypothetical protein
LQEARKERSHCLLKPKSGEAWHEIVEKKLDAGRADEEEAEAGVESSQYWLMKIEKFAKKLLDEEVTNFGIQVWSQLLGQLHFRQQQQHSCFSGPGRVC